MVLIEAPSDAPIAPSGAPTTAPSTAPADSPSAGSPSQQPSGSGNSTLAKWHTQITRGELAADGFIGRSGRWLQRRERTNEAAWLGSAVDEDERRKRARLRAESRRLHASLHHLEEEGLPDASDSERTLLKRAP